MKLIFYIISALVGILLIVFGYQIKFKKKVSLINDYKTRNIGNEVGYTNWIGKIELIIGIVITLLTIVASVLNRAVELAILDGVLIITLIVLLISGDKKYRQK